MRVSDNEAAQRVADNDNLVGELLAALQSIVDDYEFCKSRMTEWGDRPRAYAETARNTIAKAQGAQQ